MKFARSSILVWAAALLFAAMAPAAITAVLSRNLEILPLAFGVTLGHALLLGLPVALVYRSRRWTSLVAALAGSFLIGMMPGGLLALPSLFVESASVDNVPTVVGGVPTMAGLIRYLALLGILGSLGVAGGVTFWLTLRWLGELKPASPALAKGAPIRTRASIWLAAAAVVLTIGIASIPAITKDRSCHNMFRNGRRSVAPQLDIDLDITLDDWPKLAAVLDEFAKAHGMSFRDSSESEPGVLKGLGLSACNEVGQNIAVEDLRWASEKYAPIFSGRGV
ncbi:MAG TPA: hypothetical protein VGH15_10465, partial [Caulobacteraceae bacterium]